MSKPIKYTAIFMFVVTSAVWVFALFQHTFLMRELGLYVMMFLVPIALVVMSEWIMLHRKTWRKLVGAVLFVLSMGIWLVSILLVAVGFNIH